MTSFYHHALPPMMCFFFAVFIGSNSSNEQSEFSQNIIFIFAQSTQADIHHGVNANADAANQQRLRCDARYRRQEPNSDIMLPWLVDFYCSVFFFLLCRNLYLSNLRRLPRLILLILCIFFSNPSGPKVITGPRATGEGCEREAPNAGSNFR